MKTRSPAAAAGKGEIRLSKLAHPERRDALADISGRVAFSLYRMAEPLRPTDVALFGG